MLAQRLDRPSEVRVPTKLLGPLAAAALAAHVWSCVPVRPESVRREGFSFGVEERGTSRLFGRSYLTRRQGILEARFAGGAYERGYARGKLAYPEIVRGEGAIHALIDRFFPSPLWSWQSCSEASGGSKKCPGY